VKGDIDFVNFTAATEKTCPCPRYVSNPEPTRAVLNESEKTSSENLIADA
jgi:hypothetical protein